MTATCTPPISCEMDPLAVRRDEAIAWLYGRINYEERPPARRGRHALKLRRMRELLERLGDPGLAIPTIHIAGTKGKGSTAAMIAAMLQAAGRRTGLFTSPHLEEIEERFCVDGAIAEPQDFVALAEAVRPTVDEMDALCSEQGVIGPTFFEICTALALMHFERRQVDAMVLEVGLGGRLDSTNICRPSVCVITSISYDHTRQLGNTLASIAREKAGIIKPGVPVISGVTQDEPRRVIEQIAAERGCRLVQLGRDFSYRYHPADHADDPVRAMEHFDVVPLANSTDAWSRSEAEPPVDLAGGSPVGSTPGTLTHFAADSTPGTQSTPHTPVPPGTGAGVIAAALPLRLLGEHQAANAAVAVAAVGELVRQGWSISPAALRQGLAQVTLPARAEVVRRRPTVILDTAHNVASVEALVNVLETHFAAARRHLIFAATQDKDVCGMLAAILPLFDNVLLTCYTTNPRGVPVAELADKAKRCLPKLKSTTCPTVTQHERPQEAWKAAESSAGPEDLICITGSFFLAAELRQLVAGGR